MNKIGFVLPIYKDTELLMEAIPKIRAHYPGSEIIVVADDEISMNIGKELGAFVPYHSKKIGFGKSLCEGMCLAWYTFNCDSVVIADGDHPFDAIDRFLEKLKDYDVVVGHESGGWKFSRVMSNMLIRRTLFDDVTNPTCGFVVWKSDILRKIPWNKIKSNWDAVHPELLYWAKRCGGKITECMFDEVPKVRHYVSGRYFSFAWSMLNLFKEKYIGEWLD